VLDEEGLNGQILGALRRLKVTVSQEIDSGPDEEA
jgi:hypothetical protein